MMLRRAGPSASRRRSAEAASCTKRLRRKEPARQATSARNCSAASTTDTRQSCRLRRGGVRRVRCGRAVRGRQRGRKAAGQRHRHAGRVVLQGPHLLFFRRLPLPPNSAQQVPPANQPTAVHQPCHVGLACRAPMRGTQARCTLGSRRGVSGSGAATSVRRRASIWICVMRWFGETEYGGGLRGCAHAPPIGRHPHRHLVLPPLTRTLTGAPTGTPHYPERQPSRTLTSTCSARQGSPDYTFCCTHLVCVQLNRLGRGRQRLQRRRHHPKRLHRHAQAVGRKEGRGSVRYCLR